MRYYFSHIRQNTDLLVKWYYQIQGGHFYVQQKTKLKLTDFECNLIINGLNEFRNMLLSDGIPTADVDELLIKIINKSER